MKIDAEYVAGPMTNRPRFNFDTFDSVVAVRRAMGKVVFNPHERDVELYPGIDDAEATKIGDVQAIAVEVGFSLAVAMQWDIPRVAECARIVMLPEWETSSGARAERFVAELTGSEVWLALCVPGGPEGRCAWVFELDEVQRRLAGPTVEVA